VRNVTCVSGGDYGSHAIASCGQGLPVDVFDLHVCEDGLRESVVKAGALSPHVVGDAGMSTHCLEGPGVVGAATVGTVVMFLARGRSVMLRGHPQPVSRHCGVQQS